jgi:hypothetical protein
LPGPDGPELVFVVEAAKFTDKGFMDATVFSGEKVSVEFDGEGEGVYLTGSMAARLGVKSGSEVVVIVDGADHQIVRSKVSSVGSSVRLSDPDVFRLLGVEGGGVVRVRKA